MLHKNQPHGIMLPSATTPWALTLVLPVDWTFNYVFHICILDSNLDPKSTKHITYFNMHVKISNSISSLKVFQLMIWNSKNK